MGRTCVFSVMLAALALGIPMISAAQDAKPNGDTTAPRFDARFYAGGVFARNGRMPPGNMGGVIMGGSIAQKTWLRWTGELAIEFGGTAVSPAAVGCGDPDCEQSPVQVAFQVHAGPEFTKRKGRTTMYVHTLVGYGEWELNYYYGSVEPTVAGLYNDGGLSLAIGGGMDVQVARRVAVRPLQIDYIPVWSHHDPHYQGPVQLKSFNSSVRIGFSFVLTWTMGQSQGSH